MQETEKTCVAMICYGRWWLPSLRRTLDKAGNLRVLDMPCDAEFVKNTGYGMCGLPGEIWDEHADNHADKPGWLCKWHAQDDESVLQTISLQQLLDAEATVETCSAEVCPRVLLTSAPQHWLGGEMSQEEIKTEHSGTKATPNHRRDIADLAALVVSNLKSDELGEEDATLMIYVWRDCAMTIKFPSGRRMYVYPDHGHALDSTVHELAVGAITKFCKGAGIAVAEIRVHMVPSELSTGDQIFAWFQSIPGISIRVSPPEELGFGGPLPPAGEAG